MFYKYRDSIAKGQINQKLDRFAINKSCERYDKKNSLMNTFEKCLKIKKKTQLMKKFITKDTF